jgi:Ca2+-binding EF-hand superfamily protein
MFKGMGACCSAQTPEQLESTQIFGKIDLNSSKTACGKEIAEWVDTQAGLWAMLSVNLNISEGRCKFIATRVVMELATGLSGDEAMEKELTPEQFHDFRTKYMKDPKGSQEFFHRTVFAAFDADGNNSLDSEELDKLLDIFYEAGSIFKGDARLPEREDLKKLLYEKLDANKDGKFSFEEIRSLISGTASRDILSKR